MTGDDKSAQRKAVHEVALEAAAPSGVDQSLDGAILVPVAAAKLSIRAANGAMASPQCLARCFRAERAAADRLHHTVRRNGTTTTTTSERQGLMHTALQARFRLLTARPSNQSDTNQRWHARPFCWSLGAVCRRLAQRLGLNLWDGVVL